MAEHHAEFALASRQAIASRPQEDFVCASHGGGGRWKAPAFFALFPSIAQRAASTLPRTLVGLLLIVAAGFKAAQLFSHGTVGLDRSFPDFAWPYLIAAETLLGLWLLSGLQPRQSRTVGIALFTCFASYSLIGILRGEASCGCFGAVQVNPMIMLGFDLASIGLLLVSRCEKAIALRRMPRLMQGLLLVTVALLAGATVLSASLIGQRDGGTELAAFHPDEWLGRRLPLLDDIDIGEELSTGQWTVLFYHYDCPKCAAAASKLTANAQRATTGDGPKLAFIQLPPLGPPASFGKSSQVHFGQLAAGQAWDIATPMALRVADGLLIEVVPL